MYGIQVFCVTSYLFLYQVFVLNSKSKRVNANLIIILGICGFIKGSFNSF